ncbi:peptidylprolyl isomerase [Leclercia adecarboxylata]|jgi:peptidyl-prolyl cis-trans isomerase D|uniref:Periplasmic chaperone PpiD n=1 Tax=Leclercia adecarboxylata TaxID=83655 RepID=A0A7H0F8F1_9ENTR|nr:peptidylprolyl isomerase [Leclercia adecarboxylata]KFC91338.1 peptidyl-prolyl cis-trans isomerase [Leclercia adecarboxylata ATCC 23216 = NBRC 102595]MBD1405312.1 peptidylprolyl isomerase [Leclercia adecarboxylata]MDC6621280.1 peptidylprolyl isomerase [Leclercia adecarboxylata]MDC6632272.1 peptidylprolyl isomerase [Leclercia adecarboxylata]MDC6637445.1 peptidylprolyl isomerase [Leclercia adecarboxylata]
MMDSLRTAANSLVLKIIFGIIIVSFILTGVSGYLIGGSANYAAKVNDQEISRGQFENAFAGERNRMQQQLGDQFSELAANEGYMKNLRQQTLNRLIDEALLDQYAREIGLSISDDQVKKAIFSTPAFQNNGKFDNTRYNAIVNQMGMTPDQYAQALRNQLTTQQLINAVVGTDFMLKGEADELATLVSQQRVVREATFDVNALAAKQQASDEEVKSYYEQNKNNFTSPEQFRVSYIKLDAAAMQENATDAEIQTYYDQHQDQFTQPQRNRYSVIQTKTEADAKAALDELNKGTDFATVAKEKSTDIISAKNGGDMGWLEEGTTPDELKNAGLKEKGQLSGVIKSSVGFLVVRLDDITPATTKPLADVRDDIAAKVKQEKALDGFYALQQKVSDAASNDNESLAGAEQAAGAKAVTTGWFSHDNLPEELNFKPVADAIFGGGLVGENGTPGSNSDIITVDGDRAFVLRVSDHKPEAIKPLDEVKDQITALVKHNKAVQQAKLDAEKLLADLKAGKGDEALKAAGLSFGEAKTLSRTGQDPISQAAFGLSLPAKDKPSFGIANDMQGNVVVLALDEVKAGTMPEAQKKAMVQGITQNNAQITFEALMSNLRKDAKIKLGDIMTQQ